MIRGDEKSKTKPSLRAFLALLTFLAGCATMSSDESDSAGRHSGSVVPPATGPGIEPPMGTNVSFGGSQDTGFLRGQLELGLVPDEAALDDAGFFAEHHIDLPPPACGDRICLQPMVAVMGNLMNGSTCTMLHLGLNSPIAADPKQRPPLDLALVIDVSGSMQGEKIAHVRDGLELLIDGMRDGDRLALITYSDRAQMLSPLAEVADRRVELRGLVRGLEADGGTNIAEGLQMGYRELLDELDPEREPRVVLLSDGVPTQGVTDTPSILAQSRSYNSEGIGLSTIGLGADFNIDLMRGLSQQADGNFYFVEDSGAVREVFTEELAFFVVPVALDLQLELTEGDAHAFGRAFGAPAWENTSGGGSLEIPSVFVAHRESADDVTEDDGRRGGGSSLIVELQPRGNAGDELDAVIATIDLSFRDPTTDDLVSDRVTLRYPGRLGDVPREGYFQADDIDPAHKSFLMLNIYVGMERAVQEFHDGSASEETIVELDALIDAVTDYNDEIEDKDIDLDLELLHMLRDNLVRAGVPTRDRERAGDPWPAD